MGALTAQRVDSHAVTRVSLSARSYLNELFLQLENRQTLSLLQDGKLGLLAVRHLVPSEGISFPLRKVERHSADAPHVGSDLPSFICAGEEVEIDPPQPPAVLFNRDEPHR